MSLIKVAYLMLNFLNLKSFSIHLFFWVASSLSTLWEVRCLYLLQVITIGELVGQDPDPLNLKSTYNQFHPFQQINGIALFSDVELW